MKLFFAKNLRFPFPVKILMNLTRTGELLKQSFVKFALVFCVCFVCECGCVF